MKRVRTTNIEGGFLVESDNPDKRRNPTMIWKAGGDGDAQGFDLIGRVIWGWTRFKPGFPVWIIRFDRPKGAFSCKVSVLASPCHLLAGEPYG